MADSRSRRDDDLRPRRQSRSRGLRSGTSCRAAPARIRNSGLRMSLLVLDPGLHSLIVDNGRPATRSLGVPVGGAADRLSLAFGNGLVGNSPNTSALELTLAGPTLRCDAPTAAVVFGAPFTLHSD